MFSNVRKQEWDTECFGDLIHQSFPVSQAGIQAGTNPGKPSHGIAYPCLGCSGCLQGAFSMDLPMLLAVAIALLDSSSLELALDDSGLFPLPRLLSAASIWVGFGLIC